MTQIQEITFPLSKITSYNIEECLKYKKHLNLENLTENNYVVVPVKVSGEINIIRDMFVSFTKNLPQKTYAVIDFKKELEKSNSGYLFVATGNAIILKNNLLCPVNYN